MADLENTPGDYIDTAGEQMLFKSLFADIGSRESISIRDWIAGWPAIVGGINGIPTSRQFNTLQYITDMKCFMLYRAVVALQQAGATGIRIGPPQELEKNTILFETLKGTNRIVRVRRKDNEGNEEAYDLASVFKLAEKRENIQSGDTLGILFGKIARYLADLKSNCFDGTDDPFTLMTEATYRPPSGRTKGCGYGLVTDKRGLRIIFFDRYITGTENPAVDRTLYGIEKTERTELEADNHPYKAVFGNVVYLQEGQETGREEGKIYAVIKAAR
ncbi:MAG: hypothetical protein K1W20_03470 [Lachnospiraceae bacterium]